MVKDIIVILTAICLIFGLIMVLYIDTQNKKYNDYEKRIEVLEKYIKETNG